MQEKICYNCKNFVKHYAIKSGVIFDVKTGHCRERANINIQKSALRCPLFETVNCEEKLPTIYNKLSNIERSLEYIKSYLNKD